MQIDISIAEQTLQLREGARQLMHCPVSTAAKGAGEKNNSWQTPRGRHIIRAKIGAGMPINTVFCARRPTGEIYSPELARIAPQKDWILTRILWLSGCEMGKNRLGSVDTMRRYIYLHGTPEETVLGAPGSIGCIRMSNADILRLFDLVPIYTPVNIRENRLQ